MNFAEYLFSGVYAIVGLALIILIVMQQGKDRNALGSLSGSTSETYYAKNITKSSEAKMKRCTKICALLFVALNATYFFI